MKINTTDVELAHHRNDQDHQEPNPPISEELETAIQNLIYRLRELGPLYKN